MRKLHFILFLSLFLAINLSLANADRKIPRLIVFHSPTCHRCIEAKNEILPEIAREFAGKIEIEYHDISNIEEYKLMLGLKEQYKSNIELSLPIFFLEGKFANGKGELKKNLRALINYSLSSLGRAKGAPEMDLVSYFQTFTPIAIIGAGLIDGINPCAFTVIVFFISFLALQGYRKRELIPIASSFILSVFLTYLLLGVGIFNFLYKIKGFLFMIRLINISIGTLSILFGILAVYDFLKYKKTKETEGLLLQLPKYLKNMTHYVIGLHFRKAKAGAPKEAIEQKHVFKLVVLNCFKI